LRGTINPLVAVLGIGAVSVLAYFPSFAALHIFWTDTESQDGTHGYLVAAICVWLLWDRRQALRQARSQPVPAMLAVCVLLSVLWLIAWRSNLQLMHTMLVPVIFVAGVYAALGKEVAKVAVFPAAFLYFASPVWSLINGLLQFLTVKAVAIMLAATMVPAAIEQNFVFLPVGTFEIAGGCSGRQFLTVGLALGALQGELVRAPRGLRLKLLATMGGLALLCNWVRVYALVVIGHLSDMKNYLVAVDHYWFGWGLFGVFVVIFLAIARRMERKVTESPVAPATAAAAVGARWPAVAAGLFSIVAVPGAAYAIETSSESVPVLQIAPLPKPQLPWSGPRPANFADWAPIYRGAQHTDRATYINERGEQVEVFVAVYSRQSQGAELIGYDNTLSGTDFELQDERIVTIGGRQFREAVVSRRSRPAAVVWWDYEVGGRDTVRPLAAQLMYGVESLRTAPLAAIRAFRAPCDADCSSAHALLASFAPMMAPRMKVSTQDRSE
jgi:EpsI family protein